MLSSQIDTYSKSLTTSDTRSLRNIAYCLWNLDVSAADHPEWRSKLINGRCRQDGDESNTKTLFAGPFWNYCQMPGREREQIKNHCYVFEWICYRMFDRENARKTRPDTQPPKSPMGGQGPRFRSLENFGRSREAKNHTNKKK